MLLSIFAFIYDKGVTKPVDRHSSHMFSSTATFCAANGIILYCLLTNAIHVLQSCDVGFFLP